MIIGLTGPKLSGKGTASDYLQKQFGAKAFSMSGILTDIVNRLYLPNSRENLIAIVTDLRARFGEDVLAQVLKKDIAAFQEKNPGVPVIIDGIRMPMEVDVFSTLPDFHLIFIDAPMRARYERALSRGEKVGESEMTFEQFEAEENAVTESHMDALRVNANAELINASTYEDLYAALETVMKK